MKIIFNILFAIAFAPQMNVVSAMEVKEAISALDISNYKISELIRGTYIAKTEGEDLVLKPVKNCIPPFDNEKEILKIRGLLKGVMYINGNEFLAIPYFKGYELNEFMKKSEESLRIKGLKNILSELEKIHSLGIVHGDFHSGNFLFNEAGEAFIYDHDWSIILGDKISLNCRPQALGCFPSDREMSKAWDIWMLGDSFASIYNSFIECRTALFGSNDRIIKFYDLIVKMKDSNFYRRPSVADCKEIINLLVSEETSNLDLNKVPQRAPVQSCIVM